PGRWFSRGIGRFFKSCRSVLLSVHPSRALVDEKFKVLVQNASPGAELTVHSHLLSEDKHNWEAFGHYICDSTGSVNCKSLTMYFSPVQFSLFYWRARHMLRKSNVETPLEVTVSVYQGHLTEGFPEHRALAAVLVERWYMAPGVQRIPVTEHNLTATLFLPPGPGPFPAVLDLWGGGGNLVEYRSSLLASHGFAALALDYLTNDLTITTGKMMKNDYFETAYKFLEQHPQIVGSRIAMWGLSLGTAMTLKMAAYSKVMKLRCAVCYSGSHIQPVNGSTEEILNNFLKNQDKTRINEKQEVIWHDMGRVQCPLLLVVGQDDQNWPAFVSAMDIKKMMEKAGNIHLLTLLVYPDTGHLIEPPYSPHTRASTFRSFENTSLWGGQTVGHARAQEDSWRKSLMFLREHLYGRRKKSNL
uniref:Acyl-CoA thioesterase 19 n=1 Tax=Periophthalmus magnuspinnatus TaxID=409849 RepID=A0A3B4B6E9_9GOBI